MQQRAARASYESDFHSSVLGFAALLLALLPFSGRAVGPTAGEMTEEQQWAKGRLSSRLARIRPFSFRYADTSSAILLPKWNSHEETRLLDAQRRERTESWNDPTTGLEVRCVSVE